MLTWGSKFLFGLSAAAVITAVVYGLVTGGDPIGVVSSGYKGGVGDHVGYTILLGGALATFLLGVIAVVTRDGDAEVMAARAGVASVPAVTPPAAGSYWGAVSAFGLIAVVIGGVYSLAFVFLGLAVVLVAALQWLALAWSDRATGDPEVNATIRSRMMGAFEVPIWSLIAFAGIAVAMSQVFLTVSEIGAVVAGSIVSLVVFAAAIVFAKVQLPRQVMVGVVALGAVAVLAAGIVSAVRGPRDFHHHHEAEHAEDHAELEGE